MPFNIYFGQSLEAVISTVRMNCYTEYIFAYSVVDMTVMAQMFGERLEKIEQVLEELIVNNVIKAKIDATTHTLNFVQGDERINAYETVVKAANKVIEMSQEVVLKSDALFDY